jgi:hypothetical protein
VQVHRDQGRRFELEALRKEGRGERSIRVKKQPFTEKLRR